MRNFIQLSFLVIILSSCSSLPDTKKFDFFLEESCMITNVEQNNLVEGTELRVLSFDATDSTITINLPENFVINSTNHSNWVIGWGTGEPYYDAGVENVREFSLINAKKGSISLGTSMRGNGFPNIGQRIVFWNSTPSNYKKVGNTPIIHPNYWQDFNGQSIGFSSIVFDKSRKVWITLVYEVDSDNVQIYAAYSTDLINWKPANQGKPILTPSDFKNCSWTSKNQTPMVSEIILHAGKYYVFMDGEDISGKRHIGIATTHDLLGQFTIYENPILSPQSSGTWNEQSVFCAKITKRTKDFILFFDGRNEDGYEQIGRATSTDLTSWNMDVNPVLDQHIGWRSAEFTSEPNYVESRGDTIVLMAAGAKQFQESYWHHYVTHRNYLDRSGNVNDAQLGAFISFDGGKTFKPHQNNPIFVNSYRDSYENEHMGGNIERIETDTMSYFFYQAKSSSRGLKYSIFLRKKLK